MMNDKDWNDLMGEHELAYLRGDLATSSPESYTVEEMKTISDGMFESTAEVDEAMRRYFAELPPRAQAMMLDLLQESDPGHFEWWMGTLVGKTPEHAGELASERRDTFPRCSPSAVSLPERNRKGDA